MAGQLSHHDYVEVIGETHKTGRSRTERCWNRYYAHVYERIVSGMLPSSRGTVLDVGTSYGHWLPFLRRAGFKTILGVEIDSGRATRARERGYDDVFNCDAAAVPLADRSCDVAVSNDVFVHILRLEDKIAVLREVERVLRPGGVFIVNHTMSRPYGFRGYHVDSYCSFLDLDGLLRLVVDNTGFEILDIKPTYYNWRHQKAPLSIRILRRLISLPGIARVLAWLDQRIASRHAIDDADTVYLLLGKPGGAVHQASRG